MSHLTQKDGRVNESHPMTSDMSPFHKRKEMCVRTNRRRHVAYRDAGAAGTSPHEKDVKANTSISKKVDEN